MKKVEPDSEAAILMVIECLEKVINYAGIAAEDTDLDEEPIKVARMFVKEMRRGLKRRTGLAGSGIAKGSGI